MSVEDFKRLNKMKTSNLQQTMNISRNFKQFWALLGMRKRDKTVFISVFQIQCRIVICTAYQ